jgi:hypothetical protein
MRFTYVELFNAVRDANELLKKQKSNFELKVLEIRGYIVIQSINKKTKEVIELQNGLTKDEAFLWVEGHNTALINNNDEK